MKNFPLVSLVFLACEDNQVDLKPLSCYQAYF